MSFLEFNSLSTFDDPQKSIANVEVLRPFPIMQDEESLQSRTQRVNNNLSYNVNYTLDDYLKEIANIKEINNYNLRPLGITFIAIGVLFLILRLN